MAYYLDLSNYDYSGRHSFPGLKNVGWLELGHSYEVMEPTEDVLSLLWNACSVTVAQFRGLHICEFCASEKSTYAERLGKKLLLGDSEIRVFSEGGDVFAAPNLIYHYVEAHKYKPPDDFLEALRGGPRPPGGDYFRRLRKLNIEWKLNPT